MEAHNMKRLVNGDNLVKALGVKPGKFMTPALDVCLAWQFRNPHCQDRELAIEEVRKQREQLGIPLSKTEAAESKIRKN